MVGNLPDSNESDEENYIPLDFNTDARPLSCDNEVINTIAKSFPQIQDREYLEEYLRRVKDRVNILHTTPEILIQSMLVHGFKDLKSDFLKRYKKADKKRRYFINDFFQVFKENIMDDEEYNRQSIAILCSSLETVPKDIIEKVFNSNRKSLLISSIDLQERLDKESDPPTFNGQPFQAREEEIDAPDDDELSEYLRKECDNLSKEDDELEVLTDILVKQKRALSYPPLPPLFDHIPDLDDLPSNTPTMACHKCGRETPTETMGSCSNHNHSVVNSKGYVQCLMCHNCIMELIRNNYPNLRRSIGSGGAELCKRYNEVENVTIHDIPCYTTGHQISAALILHHTTLKEQAIIRGIPLASQFNQCTVQSGLCAKCLYPLVPSWKDDGVWVCGNTDCNSAYFIDIGDWAK